MAILQSRKFQAAVLAALTAGIASYTGMTTDQVVVIISPFVAFIVGQGLADFGKEAAK
jgi:hypothetical protein